MNMRKYFFVLIFVASIITFLTHSTNVEALSGSEFQAGRIIDDGVFFNNQGLSPTEIQTFLNSKVPICDTTGSQPYGNTTRANYGASKGYPPPYTCLKDYRQDTPTKLAEAGLCNTYNGGNRSAAEIIYEVSKSCGINQRVLVVLLEKEQSLITDDWPWGIQYRSATGYGCPDTAPCDSEYYGFFNQVYNAARQFKRYSKDESSYRYRAYRDNYIQYNPNAACGGTNIYIQNQATAGLYNFTPYQPNPSALSNLYGSGDSCGAYGNRNFWRIYNDWFGSTYSNEYLWRVVRTSSDPRLYLQVGNTKRWIPTSQIYRDWTLDKYSVNVISQNEIDAIPTIPELTRLGTDGQYNYVIERGRKHYLPDTYKNIWGYQNTIAAPVSNLLRNIPEYEPMGRFTTDGVNFWVLSQGFKHPISQNDLYAWGYTLNATVGIGQDYRDSIYSSNSVSRFVNVFGTKYIVDQGNLIKINDDITANSWNNSYQNIGSDAISLLPIRSNGSILARGTNSPHWYLVVDQKKYYIPNADTVINWSISPSSLLVLSSDLLDSIPTQSSYLSNFIKDTSTNMVYVVDGKKHHVVSNDLLSTLSLNPSIINVSSIFASGIPTGSSYTNPFVKITGTPHTYIFDKGVRYHLYNGDLYWAFNSWGDITYLSSTYVNNVPYSNEAISSVVKDSTGTGFLIDGGKQIRISNAVNSQWLSSNTPIMSDSFKNLMPVNTSELNTRYVTIGNTKFIADKGRKIKISNNSYYSYPPDTNSYNLINDTLPSSTPADFLLHDNTNNSSWLVNKGQKISVDFAQQLTLGFLSNNLMNAGVSSDFISSIPTNSADNFSLLIKKEGSGGIKFLNFGSALGFPDSSTLINATDNTINKVLVVDDLTYDRYPVVGSITRVLKDDNGNLYLLEAGKKRWITNWNAYLPYKNIPITYLYGTTLVQIPTGTNIN